jgi:hypothetical protein
MTTLLDAFWRAAAYCLHPKVIALSLLPLLLMGGAALLLGWLFWAPAIDAVRATLESWAFVGTLGAWLEAVGLAGLKMALAPLVVVFLATPLIVVGSLLVVALMMVPALLRLVAARRFAALERRNGGSAIGGLFVALGATAVALLALVASVPLWFVPPLVLVLPPLIWGWLTTQVMAYDVLAEHADRAERSALMRSHRLPLLAMGVLAGYLGAAPSLVWASGAISVVLAPVLVPIAIWIYTLVFAFAALWFAHYLLAALQDLRSQAASAAAAAEPVVAVAPPPTPMQAPALPPP